MSLQVITNPSEINEIEWAGFVKNHPNGNIFQTPSMYHALKNANHYRPLVVATYDEHNCMTGILLAQIQKELTGITGYMTARSIIFGGPIIDNEASLKTLLSEYNKLIENKVIYSQFRNFSAPNSWRNIFSEYGFYYDEHLNILVDLTSGEELLWKGIKKQRKEGIRKAKRSNLIFEVVSSSKIIPDFYNLLSTTYRRAKLPYPNISFFYSLYDSFAPTEIAFFSIKENNKLLVVLQAFLYQKCIYAYYVGAVSEEIYLKKRPVDLLYWEVMRWGIENKFKTFDWMGAGKPNIEYGVRNFKLEYGGKLCEFGRFEKIHKPRLYKLGKLGLNLYRKLL